MNKYGTVTRYGPSFQMVPLIVDLVTPMCRKGSYNPAGKIPPRGLRLIFSSSLAATKEIDFSFFSCGY